MQSSGVFSALCALIGLLFYTGCEKEAGFGGNSTVIGRVQLIAFDERFEIPRDTFYAMEEEVFIRVGDDITYSDRVRTNYDGYFEFPSLRRGNYEVFVYSEDSTFTNFSEDNSVVVIPFEIEEKNELKDLGTITIINNNANSGKARIRGRVKVMNYNSDYSVLLEEYYAVDERVYLVDPRNPFAVDDVRTNLDGYYEFDDLFPGEYWVYIYGEDSTGQTPGGILPVVDTVQISGNNESILLPELVRVD